MKGLNVKRIVALGLGAALVGSALAPAVMAAAFNNLATAPLERTDIMNSTGTPVVDIVVGSMGQAADVVWAGNIAAKVAQLATVDATTGAPTVDFTIGGTTTTTGDGELVDNIAVLSPTTSLVLAVDESDSSVLFDDDVDYDVNDDEVTTAVEETLYVNATAGLQTEGDGVLAGQLVANLDANEVGYRITFTPGIANFTKDDDVDLAIPFLGKTWEVRSISAAEVELRASKLSEKLFVGDSLKVTGIGAYAGKELDLVLTEVAADRDDAGSYLAEFELRDGSTVIDVLSNAEADDDIQDEFDKYFSTPVSVDTVYRQIDTSSGYVRLDTGDQAWDLKDGKELKDDGNDDADKWVVTLDGNTTHLEWIEVSNSADYTYNIDDADSDDIQGEEEDAYRMGPMAMNTSIDIADAGLYKFSFLPLTTEEMFKGKIAEGVLTLNIDNKMQEIPLSFGGTSGYTENSSKTVTVLGEEYTLYYDADANTLKMWHDISDTTDEDDDDGDSEIYFGNTVALDFNDDTIMTFANGDVDVAYNVIAYFNNTDEITYILGLSDQATNDELYVEAGSNAVVDFNGTYADKNDGDTTLVPYYLPVDMPDDIFDNWVGSDGNVLEDDDQDLYSALFTIDDGDGVAIIARVDTDSGNLIDTEDDYTGVSATDPQAGFGTVKLDSSVDDELVAAGTPFGTEVSVVDGELVWSIPESQRFAQIYLGSSDTSDSTTGGASYEGVAIDGTEGNVTIDAINGAAGKTIVSVGQIVKLDTDAVSGKSIIVGGQLVNNMAKNLQVEGLTLEERLVANGDYVAAVLDNGSIVVAGWTANDTAVAARALIAQLETFM